MTALSLIASLVLPHFRGPSQGVCVTLCNHWSYTGIGWQLGIESDVLSATDAMELFDRAGVKTCLELDAKAYAVMARDFPEVTTKLAKYLRAGKLELVGGAYGQPMATMFSGESNIRQIVEGRKTIEQAVGYELSTFLEEEEFSHPQLPQILEQAGYRYASLNQVDTWGRAGVPPIEVDSFRWMGKDGTMIPTTPKNSLFRSSLDWNVVSRTPSFASLSAKGKPLIVEWEEFGWEPPDQPTYKTAAPYYHDLAAKSPVEYVTLKQYMDEYGSHPSTTTSLAMDDWNKSLTWGLGGDQLRILNRKVEGRLLAAEEFDAIVTPMGLPSHSRSIESAWRDLLASQSHDVGLCEYSRWQQDRMAPLDRVEDHHNFTWGALGYNLLDAADAVASSALKTELKGIAAKVAAPTRSPQTYSCTVFNPCGWARSDTAESGRIYPVPAGSKDAVVRDSAGRIVPSQLVVQERDANGNLVVANVAFLAKNVPSVGYEAYSIDFVSQARPPLSDLKVDQVAYTIENAAIRVTVDANTGAVRSLVDKTTGKESLASSGAEFPTVNGKPNTTYQLRPGAPADFTSAEPGSQVSWVETGPLRATVKSRHNWNGVLVETYVSVTAGDPKVEVTTRVLTEVPPKADDSPPDIKNGYWLTFMPSFRPESVVRDYPLAVEETRKKEFHSLTFTDLVGSDGGLLVLHPGTEWFRFEPNGALSNLLMREWESTYSAEYGWPRYAEYRHALQPHSAAFTNANRLQAANDFGRPLISILGRGSRGNLPRRMSFLGVDDPALQLSSLRRLANGQVELRLVEVEGKRSRSTVRLRDTIRSAVAVDLLGGRRRAARHNGNTLIVALSPWRFQTYSIR